MIKRYHAGGEIDAWCTKCRMDLLHRIVAVVAGDPKRVECETCHSQHNYRPPRNGASAVKSVANKASTSRSRSGARGARNADSPTWESHVAGKDPANFTPFTIDKRFEVGALVSHKRFGQGCVVEVKDGKIDVLFREGRRLLAHARG